jgi:hypothetical protein
MKRLVLILFSLWFVWTQVPAGLRSEARAADAAACRCCRDCGGGCGCVAPAPSDSQPLSPATTSLSFQTELLFLAAPAHASALPFGLSTEVTPSSIDLCGGGGVPLYRRDCALRL